MLLNIFIFFIIIFKNKLLVRMDDMIILFWVDYIILIFKDIIFLYNRYLMNVI